MPDSRRLKLDLAALGLLALTAFLAAALWSYDPADPPSKLVLPERTQVLNLCGRSGATASRWLLGGIGLGAYYLVLSLGALDFVLLSRRPIGQPVIRLIGWLLSLVGLTALAAMAVPQLAPGPVIGAGGYLGAAGRTLLEMHFASVGAYILVLSLIVAGLLLCTDYLLVQVLALILGKPAQGLGQGLLHVGAAYAGRIGGRRSDLDSPEEEDREAGPSVRIAGRSAEASGADDSAEAEAVAAEAAAPAKSSGWMPRASLLRVRKPQPQAREGMLADLDASSAPAADYELPSLDLLLPSEPFSFEAHEKEVRHRATILEKTFLDFGFHIRVVEIQTGPVIAQFEVELEAGLRLSRITGLADDLAIALRVPSVRIVAPIPGKNTVGVEVPNSERQLVRLREVMEETRGKTQKMRIPVFLGKDVSGTPMVVDLSTLPHLLIAGRTGTGKSVCLNSIISSLLMTRRPDEVRMLMIDPKMVELSPYKSLPHLMHPVVTDMRKAEAILAWAVEKMEERYHLLARAGVRHVAVYNQLGEEELMERIRPENDEERRQIPTHLPYIVIVADELADLMMVAAKEVEQHIIRLAQKSRAVGIHLVVATQKPTVDVITGLIKSNLPARICFQVASRTDSRVVLDEMGADKLLGNGDMLFLWPGTSTLLRGQGTYLSDDEINRVIGAVATSEPQFVKELVQLKATAQDGSGKGLPNRDELYEAAVDLVIREGRGSVSLLQRSLGIGYGRAARLVDFMAEDGIVGQYNGSQAREVLISLEQWAEMTGQKADADTPAAPRGHKILMARDEEPEEAEPAERLAAGPSGSLAAGPGTPGVRRVRVDGDYEDDGYEGEEEAGEEQEDLDEEGDEPEDEADDEADGEEEDEAEFGEADEEETGDSDEEAEDPDDADAEPPAKIGVQHRGCA
jgi:S-DNA-T family DNA segregation ATPase FtsK/SpoIIIE